MFRLFLALRWLWTRPINLLGIVGVALSVWALVVVTSIFDGYRDTLQDHLQRATADVSIIGIPKQTDTARLRQELLQTEGINAVAPRTIWYGLVLPANGERPRVRLRTDPANPGTGSPVMMVMGIEPEAERDVTGLDTWIDRLEEADADLSVAALGDPVTEQLGRELRDIDGMPTAWLGVERMRSMKLKPGDRIRITTGRLQLQRNGAIGEGIHSNALDLELDLTVAGAFQTGHAAFDTSTVLVSRRALQTLLVPDNPRGLNEIAVDVDREVFRGRAGITMERRPRKDPRRLVQAEPRALTPEASVARALDREVLSRVFPRRRQTGLPNARTWYEQHSIELNAIDHQGSMMKLILTVILLVSGFLLFATLSMMVTEKVRDIGILTAMGATPGGIATMFLGCSLVNTVTGLALGVSTGILSALQLDNFNRWVRATFDVDLFPTKVYKLQSVPCSIDPVWIGQVCLLAIAVGLLVAGVPAWRAGRDDPLASLREE